MGRGNFRENVYAVVRRIPRGKAMSYKEVAEEAGFPRAYRAVGNLLKKNFDSRIPCHRVIRSDGGAGEYNRGKKMKIFLLRKERIIL